LSSASPTVAEQLAHSGYDWLLVDCQHGPMDAITVCYYCTALCV
jgi:4-hydroxy-2-oxoheptanedioate aldolase